jgi:hypothetical protein
MTLDELQKLVDEATPGPWVTDYAVSLPGNKQNRAIYYLPKEHHVVEVIESNPHNGECIHKESDWKFIVAARKFMPLLIEVARRHGVVELKE